MGGDGQNFHIMTMGLNLAFRNIYTFVYKTVYISRVHVQHLHPGVFLHPGGKFAPRVYFMSCERCFKKIHPGAKVH